MDEIQGEKVDGLIGCLRLAQWLERRHSQNDSLIDGKRETEIVTLHLTFTVLL